MVGGANAVLAGPHNQLKPLLTWQKKLFRGPKEAFEALEALNDEEGNEVTAVPYCLSDVVRYSVIAPADELEAVVRRIREEAATVPAYELLSSSNSWQLAEGSSLPNRHAAHPEGARRGLGSAWHTRMFYRRHGASRRAWAETEMRLPHCFVRSRDEVPMPFVPASEQVPRDQGHIRT